MIIISRNKQLLVYACLTIFGILFFVYFFSQASVVKTIEPITGPSAGVRKNLTDVKIDSKLFESDKFRNLRFDKLPASSFNYGKRNPFESY
jgi:hypothetical protein